MTAPRGGNNFGTKGAQQSVDGFEKAIDKLTRAIESKMTPKVANFLGGASSGTRALSSARTAASDVWNGTGRWGGWGRIGGSVTFGGNRPTEHQGPPRTVLELPMANDVITAMKKPNGGRPSFSTPTGSRQHSPAPPAGSLPDMFGGISGPIKAAGAGIASGVSYFGGMSGFLMDNTAEADWMLRRSAMVNGGSNRAYTASMRVNYGNGRVGGYNTIGMSHADIAQGIGTTMNYVGSAGITNRQSPYQQFMRQAGQVGYADPTLGAAGAARQVAAMRTPQTLATGMMYGLGMTVNGGSQMSPLAYNTSVMNRVAGGRNLTAAETERSLREGYGGMASLRAANPLANEQDLNSYRTSLIAQAKAGERGVSSSDFQKLLADAGNGNTKAQQRLERFGIGKSQVESMKRMDSASRRTEAEIMDDFSNALQEATKIMRGFTEGITNFLKATHLDKIIGSASAWTGTVSKVSSGPMGLLGLGIGTAGKMAGWMTSGLGGDGPANMGSGSASKTPETKQAGTGGPTGNSLISAAMGAIGKPYVFGASGPRSYDCSGLTLMAYKKVTGKSLPHRATLQWKMSKSVSAANARPGDLVFFNGTNKTLKHHVGIYLGGGKLLHAPQPGQNVKIEKIWGESHVFGRLPGINAGVGGVDTANGQTAGGEPTQNDNTAGGDVGKYPGGTAGVSSIASSYGSVEEIEALAAALSGGKKGGETGSTGSGDTKDNGSTKTKAQDSSGGSVTDLGVARGGRLDATGVAGLVKNAGIRSLRGIATAVAIAKAESGFNPRAHNPNRSTGDDSYGLWQINMLGSMGPSRRRQFHIRSNEELYSPSVNARIMSAMSGGGRNWSPWSTYKRGEHSKYMGAAEKAAASVLGESGRSRRAGAFEVASDGPINAHAGEMLLNPKDARTVRQALLESNLGTWGNKRSGGGLTVHFAEGAVKIDTGGTSVTTSTATELVRQVIDQLEDNTRLEKIMAGL